MRGVVLPVAALALVLSISGLGGPERWELAFALWRSEPWRLVTGHLAWDLAVFVGLGLACELGGRGRTAAALALAVPAIAVGAPLLTPGLAVYRGLSGLDSALFTLLAARCLRSGGPRAARIAGGVAVAALGGKIAWELVTGSPLFVTGTAGVAVVPAAHLFGGLAGLAVGSLPRRRPSAAAGGGDAAGMGGPQSSPSESPGTGNPRALMSASIFASRPRKAR